MVNSKNSELKIFKLWLDGFTSACPDIEIQTVLDYLKLRLKDKLSNKDILDEIKCLVTPTYSGSPDVCRGDLYNFITNSIFLEKSWANLPDYSEVIFKGLIFGPATSAQLKWELLDDNSLLHLNIEQLEQEIIASLELLLEMKLVSKVDTKYALVEEF